MVDASPQQGRPSHQHTRSSLFGFSFNKIRSNSASSTGGQSLLNTVRESTGARTAGPLAGNPDEFGLSRPPTQQQQQQQSSSSLAAIQMASSSAPQGQQRLGSQQGPGADQQQQQQQQQSQSPAPQQQPTQTPQRQLHPEIRSIVNLSTAHAHKIYFSGPLVKHTERHTDGKIVGKEEPWREVWAQLGGTTLSVWDMKEIEEASKRGAEVPPTYLNITDASIHVLGAVTMPSPNGVPVKYMNVITLTTAGLNLLLFSCPSPQALVAWTAALRLSAYEKSRLEELYTAHLLRMSLSENGIWKDPRSPLVNGRLEGWVKIRINGQTDWKRLWMCVQAGQPDAQPDAGTTRKHRMSSLFGRASHEHNTSVTSIPSPDRNPTSTSLFDPRLPYTAFYASAKPRDRKKGLLTLINVTQVFAVYPERPELISRSTLIKMEGFIGDEELAGEWRSKEGWVLMMPEAEPGKLGSLEMLKWLVGLHDAFGLYGRPAGYTWNPRDPQSLMFAYPVGPHKDNLFLDRELAEAVDPREDRGSVVRQRFKEILTERMYGREAAQRMSMGLAPQVAGNGSAAPPDPPSTMPPSLPPIQSVAERRSEESQESQRAPQKETTGSGTGGASGPFQLPPLSFDSITSTANVPPTRETSSLSPITERTDSQSLSRGSTQDHAHISPATSTSLRGAPKPSTIEEEGPSVLSNRRVESPPPLDNAFKEEPEQSRAETTSLPPRFTQKSGTETASSSISTSASASGSGSGVGSGGGVACLTRGARSPPLSPDSSISRYSQPESPTPSTGASNTNTGGTTAKPEQVPLPASTTTLQAPSSVPERDALSSFYQYQSPPVSSVPPRLQQYLQPRQYEPVPPPTPGSTHSNATYMSSPFSINERNKDQPPAPPEKSTIEQQQERRPPASQQQQTSQQWEPQYRTNVRQAEYVFDEPGALYLMQQQREAQQARGQGRRSEYCDESDEEERSEEEEHAALTNPMSLLKSPMMHASAQASASPAPVRATPSPRNASPSPSSPPPRVPFSPVPRRQTPGGFEVVSGAVGVAALATVSGSAAVSPRSARSGSLPDTSSIASGTAGTAGNVGSGSGASGTTGVLGVDTGGPRGLSRRPSGARAPQQRVGGMRFVPTSDSQSSNPQEVDEQAQQHSPPPPPQPSTSPHLSRQRERVQEPYKSATREMSLQDDETVVALAALNFLEQLDASGTSDSTLMRKTSLDQQQQQQRKSSTDSPALPAPPTILEPDERAPSPPSQQSTKQMYRSSFAPSKQAAERKARSAAQQAAYEEVLHKPGRPNGKQRAEPKQREGGWESSEEDEEEEEEEEEDDDDDVGTDDEPRAVSRGGSTTHSIPAPVGRNPMVQQQMRGLSPSNSASEEHRDQNSQQRHSRTLPQIPQRGQSPGSDRRHDHYEGPRDSSMARTQSQYPHQQYPPQLQQHQQYQQPSTARQNIWSSVLDTKTDTGMPGPNMNNNNRDTFVQIETPAETMTKAFTPQGLLSAGMQDKEERSAKRQEEVARETGASLINVPSKPPPPQVGLLGAITAHERERKRDGGMGATLTEREREKRLAEERQRRLDELQRQQLEQMTQFGGGMGMYGGGLSPQMTGMNPMMGGFGAYPMQSGYFSPMFPMMNPQHMYAAQAAAQAYQQAMIAMSTAGSQVGGDGRNTPGGDRTSQNLGGGMTPMVTPSPGMLGPVGYDPRMSMMSMGGMMPMMPMGGMSPMASPMGMQMTGGSGMGAPAGGGMDQRFSMFNASGNFDGAGGGLGIGGGVGGGGNAPGASGQQSQRSYNGSPRGSPAPGPSNRTGNGNGNANGEENTVKTGP